MKLNKDDRFGAGRRMGPRQMGLRPERKLAFPACLFPICLLPVRLLLISLLLMAMANVAGAQTLTTTTVQGTVYLANGQAASGTLVVSWPAFTTASGQSVTADRTTVAIATNGSVSVNLAPNLGATPAGLYYTAVFYLSDGTSTTQYSEFSTALFINLPIGS